MDSLAYDGLVLAAITHELTAWIDARVEKIHQPTAAVLLLSLHHPQLGKAKLLIATDPTAPRLHLTDSKWSNPASPPMFCMLLRKYLEGGRLQQIEQHGLERILTFSFSGRDDLGNSVTYRLVAELLGRHSNLLLLSQEERILDAMVRVPPAMSSVRIILPGLTYSWPDHQSRLDTLQVGDLDRLQSALAATVDAPLSKALVAGLTGISPRLAGELLLRAGLSEQTTVRQLTTQGWTALLLQLRQLRQLVERAEFLPCRFGQDYAALLLSQPGALAWPGTMNQLVDQVSTEAVQSATLQKQRQRLSAVIRQVLQKDRRKQANQERELAEMQADLELRSRGELILANQHLIPAKAERAKVIDYYHPDLPEVELALDPRLSAVQNAQRAFRRYERARHGGVVVEQNLVKTKASVAYLESLLDSIERADQMSLLAEIEQEMQQSGLLPAPPKRKQPEPSQSEPLRFRGPDDCEILVGRNNLQNERLTRGADPNDWWLHAKDIPGSHVIVRGVRGELDAVTLQVAAGLAAYFSRARQSSKVPVDYTRRKHVRKPNSAPPGFVIYTNQQTVMIEPQLPESD